MTSRQDEEQMEHRRHMRPGAEGELNPVANADGERAAVIG
jgi:hypothetical protein